MEFEKELLDQFKQKYPKQPGEKAFYDYSRPLYVQIYYFCKNKRGRDVDNIMKYMTALTNISISQIGRYIIHYVSL